MYIIDKELCIGCGKCVDVCPADAIALEEQKAEIDQSLCRQCGVCVRQCPVQAISERGQVKQQFPDSQQSSETFSQIIGRAGSKFLRTILQAGGPGSGRGHGRGGGGRGGGRGRGGRR